MESEDSPTHSIDSSLGIRNLGLGRKVFLFLYSIWTLGLTGYFTWDIVGSDGSLDSKVFVMLTLVIFPLGMLTWAIKATLNRNVKQLRILALFHIFPLFNPIVAFACVMAAKISKEELNNAENNKKRTIGFNVLLLIGDDLSTTIPRKQGEMLDGVSDGDTLADYLDDKMLRGIVSGGDLFIKYIPEKNEARYVTNYLVERKLTESELESLLDFTTGQWSDGAGEGFGEYILTNFDVKINPANLYGKEDDRIISVRETIL